MVLRKLIKDQKDSNGSWIYTLRRRYDGGIKWHQIDMYGTVRASPVRCCSCTYALPEITCSHTHDRLTRAV